MCNGVGLFQMSLESILWNIGGSDNKDNLKRRPVMVSIQEGENERLATEILFMGTMPHGWTLVAARGLSGSILITWMQTVLKNKFRN